MDHEEVVADQSNASNRWFSKRDSNYNSVINNSVIKLKEQAEVRLELFRRNTTSRTGSQKKIGKELNLQIDVDNINEEEVKFQTLPSIRSSNNRDSRRTTPN